MTTLNPMGENVLLKPIEAEEQTKAGIILTNTAKDQENKATVVAIGPKVEGISVGDIVYYSKYASDVFKVDGVELTVIPSRGVLAIEA